MTRVFISYRSLDAAKVDMLVARLRNLKTTQNTPRFTVWQDKTSIPAGHDWWQSIVNAIIDCQFFIFMVSEKSVQNANCRAELSYARRRNRPIIPVMLDGEFTYDPEKDKNDINFWEHIPNELNDLRSQFLFYEGGGFVQQLENSIAQFESDPEGWKDIEAARPVDPRNASDTTNSDVNLYDAACDFAWRLEFTMAERLFSKLVHLQYSHFRKDARDWIEILRLYQELLNLDVGQNTRYQFVSRWQEYEKHFPTRFTQLFDPKGIQQRIKDPPPESPIGSPIISAIVNMSSYDYIDRGNQHLSKGEYDEAIGDFDEAIRLNKDDAETYYLRGLAHENKEDYQTAASDYTKAIRIDSEFEDARHHRGISRYKLGRFDGAIADFDEAIHLNPKYADAFYFRGLIRFLNSIFDAALADFDEAIRLNPKCADAFYFRGIIRMIEREYGRAIADFGEAIRLNPKYADAFYYRGIARYSKNDYDGAITDYTNAIDLKPNYPEAFCSRGNAQYSKNDYDGAITDYTNAIDLKPNYPEAYRRRGLCRTLKVDYENAITDCTEAITLNIDDAEAYYLRGMVRTLMEDFYGALADYEMTLKIDPNFAAANAIENAIERVRQKIQEQ